MKSLSDIDPDKFTAQTVKIRKGDPRHKHSQGADFHYDIVLEIPEGRFSIGYVTVTIGHVSEVLDYIHPSYHILYKDLLNQGSDDATEIIRIDALDMFEYIRWGNERYRLTAENLGQQLMVSILDRASSQGFSHAYMLLSGWENGQFRESKNNNKYGLRQRVAAPFFISGTLDQTRIL